MIANLFTFIENATGPVSMALLQSLWQGALVAIILAAILFVLRGRAPKLCYAMSCIGLLLVFALAVATVMYQGVGDESALAASSSLSGIAEQASLQSGAIETSVLGATADFNSGFSLSARLSALTPWIFSVWFLGVVALSYSRLAQSRLSCGA